ncbi:MAG: GNAT family N-acetyltransferase [Gimesia chilikensis]|uniref:GNAT family N-acetyltransferase n=1 Tax=Gimesia chilikensis TaxID=2605989 RepID=UPI0037B6263B
MISRLAAELRLTGDFNQFRISTPPMSITVSLASAEELPEASAFIFADATETEREIQIQEFQKTISAGQEGQNQVLLAHEAGLLLGVGILVFSDPATSCLWPPFTSRKDCADEILQEMARRIDESGVSIGQVLIDPAQLHTRRLLTRNGFPHLTNLQFMRHPLSNLPSTESLKEKQIEPVRFDAVQNRRRFLDMLELTHQESHDCPALNQVRTAEESLESHRSSGDSDQAHWYLFQRGETDLGILLLSEHQSDLSWEVVYMGVAPNQRGQGTGSAMIQFGLEQARAHNQSALTLAVDHKNSYAIKIYEELGFVRQNTLSVHARLRSQFPGKKPKFN